MIIDVNNCGRIEIEKEHGSVIINWFDGDDKMYHSKKVGEGDIVMMLNLLNYMMWKKEKSVYLLDDDGRKKFHNQIVSDEIEEFRIFQ